MSASSRSLATVAITALLGPGALAAAAPGPATARFGAGDLAKIVGFSSPQLSPDGTRVAVVVTRIDENADEYVRDLDLVDVRTHARRTLVAKRKGLADPAWSSSGDRLAFIADEGAGDDAHAQVFVLPMDGGDSRAVTHAPEGVEQFAWRPDGNALAYAAEDAKPKLAGAAKFYDSYEVGNTPITGHAAARPAHLWTLDLASGAPARQHTFGPRSVATCEARSSLSLSPDGRELAYLDAPNNVLNDATDAHVAMLDVATGRVRSASGDAGFDGDPQFSPDGTKLAYVHSLGDSQIALARVYVTPVAGAPRGVPAPRRRRSISPFTITRGRRTAPRSATRATTAPQCP